MNLSTRKSKLIILISLFVVFVISGGYLLWRINQPEELAPGYSEANNNSSCVITGACYIVANTCVGNCTEASGGGWGYCNTCGVSPGVSPDPTNCENRVASDVGKAVGQRCIGKDPYTYECGAWCYLQANGPNCCVSPTPPTRPTRPTPPTPTTHRITYYPNGGSCSRPSESVIDGGNSLGPGTCTRPGYSVNYYRKESEYYNMRKESVPCCSFYDGSSGKCTGVMCDYNVVVEWKAKSYPVTYPICGDGYCDPEIETAANCPHDCVADCGDGYCTHDETVLTCPEDCEANCGDGYCTHEETNETCPEDCSADCGDGYCDPETETAANCPADCEANCGDDYCTHDEDVLTCPEDCLADCGDGYCTHDETNQSCPIDCPADCGDDYCDPETETAANCPADCVADCGDGYCTHDETSATCPEDCGPAATAVPETGIFDDSNKAILTGFVLLLLGFTWRILGRGIHISISFLGRIPKKISIQMKDIQQERRLKRDIKRKQEFEKKVVKD